MIEPLGGWRPPPGHASPTVRLPQGCSEFDMRNSCQRPDAGAPGLRQVMDDVCDRLRDFFTAIWLGVRDRLAPQPQTAVDFGRAAQLWVVPSPMLLVRVRKQWQSI
jgi:hypothetical protein